MGLLIDGVWHDKGYDTQSTGAALSALSPSGVIG